MGEREPDLVRERVLIRGESAAGITPLDPK